MIIEYDEVDDLLHQLREFADQLTDEGDTYHASLLYATYVVLSNAARPPKQPDQTPELWYYDERE
jgi:hypothetical protein